jgi:hypothetical protein
VGFAGEPAAAHERHESVQTAPVHLGEQAEVVARGVVVRGLVVPAVGVCRLAVPAVVAVPGLRGRWAFLLGLRPDGQPLALGPLALPAPLNRHALILASLENRSTLW